MMSNRVEHRDRPEFKRRLLQNLAYGQARAKKGPLLHQQCGYKTSDDRPTRMMIRELIADGIPVASSTGKVKGYFIAETTEEVNAYIEQLTDRIREDAKRLRDFKKAARRVTHPEQLRMTIY